MTLHACIVGIDGSGKSSAVRALPEALARRGLVAACAGETFLVARPVPDGLATAEPARELPISAALASRAKLAAKRLVDFRALYPPFKLAQMILQDSAAWRLGRRIGADVVVSDGNLLVNAAGRAGNYRRAASRGEAARPAPTSSDLAALFRLLEHGDPLPPAARATLPPVSVLGPAFRALRATGLRPAWVPDLVVMLDVSPETALARIRSRGAKIDAHENAADLAQAREAYLRALAAVREVKGEGAAVALPCDALTQAETLERVSGLVAGACRRA